MHGTHPEPRGPPTPDVEPARGFLVCPTTANQLEPPVTAILNPQLKNGTTAQQAPAAPVRPEAPAVPARPAMPAMLMDHVTKRFVVGRGRKPVLAISDVSLRLERGDIHGILGANG